MRPALHRCLAIGAIAAWAATAQTPLGPDRPADAVAVAAPATIAAGGHGILKITLRIMEDGHANSNVPGDPDLIPTTFKAAPAAGIVWGRTVFPEPQSVREVYSPLALSVFETGAVIEAPFTIDSATKPGPVALSGVLQTQVCDHEQCYPPIRIQLAATVKVSPLKK